MRLNQVRTYGIALLDDGEVAFVFKTIDKPRKTVDAGVCYAFDTETCNGSNYSRQQQILTFGIDHPGYKFDNEIVKFWELEDDEAYELMPAIREALKDVS